VLSDGVVANFVLANLIAAPPAHAPYVQEGRSAQDRHGQNMTRIRPAQGQSHQGSTSDASRLLSVLGPGTIVPFGTLGAIAEKEPTRLQQMCKRKRGARKVADVSNASGRGSMGIGSKPIFVGKAPSGMVDASDGSLRLSTSERVPAGVIFGFAGAIAETNTPFRLQICNQAKSEVVDALSASSTASGDIGSRPISVTCLAKTRSCPGAGRRE
jgi:hypothetical protein